jgi:transaldolase
MAKAGVTNQLEAIQEIYDLVEESDHDIESISVELLDPTKSLDDLLKEAMSYADIEPKKITIKIPFIGLNSLKLTHMIHREGISVNMTCIMSAYQGILARSCRPEYISFFYNRMIDWAEKTDYTSQNYAQEQIKILNTYLGQRITTRIICGSIRDVFDVQECFDAGADIVTVPYDILLKMFKHDKTTEAIEEFTNKWKAQRK